MANQTEIKEQSNAKQQDLQKKISGISKKVVELTSKINSAVALVRTGYTAVTGVIQRMESTTMSVQNLNMIEKQLLNSPNKINNSLDNVVSEIPRIRTPKQITGTIGGGVSGVSSISSSVVLTGANSVSNTISNGFSIAQGVLRSAIELLDKAIQFAEENNPQTLPDLQQTKTGLIKLEKYQKELDQYKADAQGWIQNKTDAVTSWISSAQNSIQEQIQRKSKLILTAVSGFIGMDTKMLSEFLESAPRTIRNTASSVETIKDYTEKKEYDSAMREISKITIPKIY